MNKIFSDIFADFNKAQKVAQKTFCECGKEIEQGLDYGLCDECAKAKEESEAEYKREFEVNHER